MGLFALLPKLTRTYCTRVYQVFSVSSFLSWNYTVPLMTLEEFTKEVIGDDISDYSQEEIKAFYTASTGFFNLFFNKWKKEKISSKGNALIDKTKC